jgi:hypothetical protein
MKKILFCVVLVFLIVPPSKSETASKSSFDHHNLDVRLKAFINEYCQIYEQMDLDKFSTLFASNAVENGAHFTSLHSKYRQNFKRIDSIEYDIKLERYATHEEAGLVKLEGIFNISFKLIGSEKLQTNSGKIFMVLVVDGNSFKVKQLDY